MKVRVMGDSLGCCGEGPWDLLTEGGKQAYKDHLLARHGPADGTREALERLSKDNAEYCAWLRATAVADPADHSQLEPAFADGDSVSIFNMSPDELRRAHAVVASAVLKALGRYWERRALWDRQRSKRKLAAAMKRQREIARRFRRQGFLPRIAIGVSDPS